MITQFVELDKDFGSEGRYFNPFGPPMFHFKLSKHVFNLVYKCIKDFQNQTDFKKDQGQIVQGTLAEENQKNSIVNGEICGIDPQWQFEHHNGILANCVNEITYQYASMCLESQIYDLSSRESEDIDKTLKQDLKSLKPTIEHIWYVNLKEGDFHVLHDHNNQKQAIFSGAIYLETPDAPYPQGKINWIVSGNGGGMYNNVYGIVPKARDVFIWPSWMTHSVYPFRGSGNRLMISFNSACLTKKDNDE